MTLLVLSQSGSKAQQDILYPIPRNRKPQLKWPIITLPSVTGILYEECSLLWKIIIMVHWMGLVVCSQKDILQDSYQITLPLSFLQIQLGNHCHISFTVIPVPSQSYKVLHHGWISPSFMKPSVNPPLQFQCNINQEISWLKLQD